MLKLTLLEERRLQATVPVPMLRAFRAELREERASAIARKAPYDWLPETAQHLLAQSRVRADATPMPVKWSWAHGISSYTMFGDVASVTSMLRA